MLVKEQSLTWSVAIAVVQSQSVIGDDTSVELAATEGAHHDVLQRQIPHSLEGLLCPVGFGLQTLKLI